MMQADTIEADTPQPGEDPGALVEPQPGEGGTGDGKSLPKAPEEDDPAIEETEQQPT